MKPAITIFTKYNTMGASSRLRYFTYLPYLKEAGFPAEIYSFLDNHYLRKLYRTGKRSPAMAVKAYGKRLIEAVRSHDNLILEYELFPYLPYWFEHLFLRNKKYILNFDDNIWYKYGGKAFLKEKINRLSRGAAGIIAANEYIYQKTMELNDNVIKIPTVVDLSKYRRNRDKYDKFTIVWIGTPITYVYVMEFAGMLKQLAAEIDFELFILASAKLRDMPLPGVTVKYLDWSADREAEILSRCHLGIMPLTNDEFSQGKSAFKIIQYLASGLPVIASPIGENRHIVKNGINGFLADTQNDWLTAAGRLYHDRALYAAIADEAEKSAADYSLQKYIPVFLEFIRRTFNC